MANITTLWRQNFKRLPMRVHRNWHGMHAVIVALELRHPGDVYGRAHGYLVADDPKRKLDNPGSPESPVEIPNAGCHGWSFYEQPQ